MKTILLTILVLAALAAGCVGSSAPAETASGKNETAAAADATKSAALATPLDAANQTAAPKQVPFAFDGKIPQFAEACAFALVTGVCKDLPPSTDFTTLRASPEFGGTPLSGTLRATWTSAAPSEDKLVFSAFSYNQNAFKSYGAVVGPSPLKLDLKALVIPPGQKFYVGLFPPQSSATPGPAGAYVTGNPVEQPFHLDGSFLVEPK